MDEHGDGGPAFPQFTQDAWGKPRMQDGMTPRDYFAAKAMPLAWKAEHDSPIDRLNGPKYEHIAGIAYLMADAMLKARNA